MIQASAPGKLMLMGEHAVLHGRRALVAAVNQRVTVCLRPRADFAVTITSALGNWQGTLSEVTPVRPLRFVMQAIVAAAPECGFDLSIQSDFQDDVGLGSSSAVTVAVVAALDHLCTGPSSGLDDSARHRIFAAALAVVRHVQGQASGADLAAAVYGGVVAYRCEPLEITALPGLPPILAVYSGSKRRTREVIALVEQQRIQEPGKFEAVFAAMEACVEQAIAALAARDWQAFGRLLDQHQSYMQAIGVSNDALAAIIQRLRAIPGIYGAKISGAGLGDCVIAVGTPTIDCGALDLHLASAGVAVLEICG